MDARLPFGLCAFGLSYTCGFVGSGERANPRPIGMSGLLDLAAGTNLRWAEIPPHVVPREGRRELRVQAAALGVKIVAGGRRVDPVTIAEDLAAADELGARVLRVTLSGILCGDRRAVGLAGWQQILDRAVATLRGIAPEAEARGIVIGVENHQDATSSDLVWLCQAVDSPAVGLTLDTGNALPVLELPEEFARRVLPYLVDVHLKDYRIVGTRDGFRLCHCPIGSGVLDFEALFELFAGRPDLPRSIELAALGERHVRCLEESWWDGYPPRSARSVAEFLRFWRAVETDGDWRTPFDRGEPRVAEWELDCLLESIENLTRIASGDRL